jgi:hypothetical protein
MTAIETINTGDVRPDIPPRPDPTGVPALSIDGVSHS